MASNNDSFHPDPDLTECPFQDNDIVKKTIALSISIEHDMTPR